MQSSKYELPPEMEDAILVVETGLIPSQLDELSENLISYIMLYRAIRETMRTGGELKL